MLIPKPHSMSGNKAWQYTTRGRLSNTIEQVDLPIPEPKDDEVVVRIQAVALNPVEEQV